MPELIVGRQYVTAEGRIVTALEVLEGVFSDPEKYIAVERSELGIDPRNDGHTLYYYTKDSEGRSDTRTLDLVAMLPEHLTGVVVPESVESWDTEADFKITEEGYYITRTGLVVYVYRGAAWRTKDHRVFSGEYWNYESNGRSYFPYDHENDIVARYEPSSYMYEYPKQFTLGKRNNTLYSQALKDPKATVINPDDYDYDWRTHTSLWAWNPDTKTYRGYVVCGEYVNNKNKVKANNVERRLLHYTETYNRLTNYREYIENYVCKKVESGEFKDLPQGIPTQTGTGAHVSTENPELIAFYPTLRHIKTLRAQQIKPGRYLKRYFPHMSDDRIRMLSAKMAPGELRFFSDWSDMYEQYYALNESGIVSSCMSKHESTWEPVHPLMVYHNSDVELAVLYVEGKPVARALYNKVTKQYPMIYGQWEKMQVVLEKNGFKHGALDGAKINRLKRYPEDGEELVTYEGKEPLLIPYIDHKRPLDRSEVCSTHVNDMGDHLVIEYGGAYNANDYDNVTLHLDGSDDNDSGESFICECCGGRFNEDSANYVSVEEITVCDSCWESEVEEVRVSNGIETDITYATRSYCRNNYTKIYDRWYEDDYAISAWGYVWSEYDNDYYKEHDVVWVEYESDYYHVDDIGDVIQVVDDGDKYVTTGKIIDNLGEYYLNPNGFIYQNLFYSHDNGGDYDCLESLPESGSYTYEACPDGVSRSIWEAIWKDHKPQQVAA